MACFSSDVVIIIITVALSSPPSLPAPSQVYPLPRADLCLTSMPDRSSSSYLLPQLVRLPQTGVVENLVDAVPSTVRVSRIQTPPSKFAISKKSKFSLRREMEEEGFRCRWRLCLVCSLWKAIR